MSGLKRAAKILLALLVILLVVLGSLLVTWSRWAPGAMSWVLEQNGVAAAFADVERPGSDTWRLGDLQLSIGEQRLHLTGVEVSYQLDSLSVDRLLVDEAALRLRIETLAADLQGEARVGSEAGLEAEWPLPPWLPNLIRVERLAMDADDGDLVLDGSFQLDAGRDYELTLTDGASALAVRGELTPQQLVARGELSLIGPLMTRALTAADLASVEAALRVAFDLSLPEPLTPDPKRLAGSARAQLEASFDWQDGRVFLASDAVTVETGWPLRFEAERLSVSGTHGAEWRYPTSLQGSYGEVLTLRVGTLLDGQVRLAPEPSLAARVKMDDAAWAVLRAISGEQVGGALAGQLEATSSSLSFAGPVGLTWRDADVKVRLPANHVRLDASRPDGSWVLRGHLSGPGLAVELSGDLADDDELALTGTYSWTVSEPLLESTLGWEEDGDLLGGVLQGQMRLEVGKQTVWRVQGTLTDGRATYDTTLFDGISGSFDATGAGGQTTLRLPHFEAANVNVGVEMTELTTSGQVTSDRLLLDHLQARLLGGSARLAQPTSLRLTEQGAEGTLAFDLAEIDLAEVLALEGEQIRATGRLTGRVPVTLDGDQVRVVDARLRAAEPGGHIALDPEYSRAAAQPGLDFALRALEDFRYSKLDATVQYEPNGDLAAAVRLEGRNPEIERGRPIHYNLNIGENVPILLESLRLQDAVTEQVERRVRDRR